MLLGLNRCTPNGMVYGGTGRMPIINHVKARMVTFHMRLINGKNTKLSYIMYKASRKKSLGTDDFQSKRIEMIRNVLISSDMGDIWLQEGMSHTTKHVEKIVKYRIKELFFQALSLKSLFDSSKEQLINISYFVQEIMHLFRCINS